MPMKLDSFLPKNSDLSAVNHCSISNVRPTAATAHSPLNESLRYFSTTSRRPVALNGFEIVVIDHQQDASSRINRCLRGRRCFTFSKDCEIYDFLRNAVFENFEIVFRQIENGLAVGVVHRDKGTHNTPRRLSAVNSSA